MKSVLTTYTCDQCGRIAQVQDDYDAVEPEGWLGLLDLGASNRSRGRYCSLECVRDKVTKEIERERQEQD